MVDDADADVDGFGLPVAAAEAANADSCLPPDGADTAGVKALP